MFNPEFSLLTKRSSSEPETEIIPFYNLVPIVEKKNNQIQESTDYLGWRFIFDRNNASPISQLDLSSKRLRTLPPSIHLLNHLSVLVLNNCNLTEIPASVEALTDLITLEIKNNQIKNLMNLKGLISLRSLNISQNPISKFSKSFENLTNLEELYAHHLEVKSLPETLCKLNKLKKLYLSNNKISKISKDLSLLTCLEELDLEANQLKFLPDCFYSLLNLEKLNLKYNKIRSYPHSLCLLSLKIFEPDTDGTPI